MAVVAALLSKPSQEFPHNLSELQLPQHSRDSTNPMFLSSCLTDDWWEESGAVVDVCVALISSSVREFQCGKVSTHWCAEVVC